MPEASAGFHYAATASTAICLDAPCEKNPFLARKRYIAGYDIEALTQHASYTESLLTMFSGNFPSTQNARLLEKLMIGLMNLGPRDPAIKAAMVAGGSKTNPQHLLPIGLLIAGGDVCGAREVEQSYRFIEANMCNDAAALVAQLMATERGEHAHIAPGFGRNYGDIDPIMAAMLTLFLETSPSSEVLQWTRQFVAGLAPHHHGVLETGLAAAVLLELNVGARESIGLYQLIRAPGIIAHAMEQTHKPITAIPMLGDDAYEFSNR